MSVKAPSTVRTRTQAAAELDTARRALGDALEAQSAVALGLAQAVRSCAIPGVRRDDLLHAPLASSNRRVVAANERYQKAYDRMVQAGWPVPFVEQDSSRHLPPLRLDTIPGVFLLYRHTDAKQQSGTGTVAVGFVFPERRGGDTFTCWRAIGAADRGIPEAWSTTTWTTFAEAIAIHSHATSPTGADTSLVWLIQPAGGLYSTPPLSPTEGA